MFHLCDYMDRVAQHYANARKEENSLFRRVSKKRAKVQDAIRREKEFQRHRTSPRKAKRPRRVAASAIYSRRGELLRCGRWTHVSGHPVYLTGARIRGTAGYWADKNRAHRSRTGHPSNRPLREERLSLSARFRCIATDASLHYAVPWCAIFYIN